jgi:2-alkenal reductase
MKSQRRSSSIFVAGLVFVLFALLAGSVVGGVVGYTLANTWDGEGPAAVQRPSSVATGFEPANAVGPSASRMVQTLTVTEQSAGVEAVRAVLPAVVTVETLSGFGGGSGTGFFISEDGYVVTNHHVVEGARDIRIAYGNGGTAPAQLVGSASEFDLAVLQIDGPAPAVAVWGDSSELPLGSTVIAIGSALGEYRNSVTSGVLSGFNRRIPAVGMDGLLQTDAAINQGNSGGPLINLAGQVIGVNTIVARGNYGEAEGLGFAIPSNIAQNVARNLIETGEARQPFLGIQFEPLNPQLAMEQGLSINQGALLRSVVDGTPAQQAGLRVGDVIVGVDGQTVDDRNTLVSLLFQHVAGDTITLDVLREGQTFQTQLTLTNRI